MSQPFMPSAVQVGGRIILRPLGWKTIGASRQALDPCWSSLRVNSGRTNSATSGAVSSRPWLYRFPWFCPSREKRWSSSCRKGGSSVRTQLRIASPARGLCCWVRTAAQWLGVHGSMGGGHNALHSTPRRRLCLYIGRHWRGASERCRSASVVWFRPIWK